MKLLLDRSSFDLLSSDLDFVSGLEMSALSISSLTEDRLLAGSSSSLSCTSIFELGSGSVATTFLKQFQASGLDSAMKSPSINTVQLNLQ